MTAPFPTRKQEAWRYADLDALKPVWEQLARAATLIVAARRKLKQVWLPTGDDVQVRRVADRARRGRARAHLRAQHARAITAASSSTCSLARRRATSSFTRANIGGGESTNEIVTIVRHRRARGRSRQTVRSVLGGKAVGSYLGKVEVARGAQQTDGEQSVKAMLLDRGATANCKPELEIYADDVKCAHGATVGELDAEQLFYAMSRGLDPASAQGAAARRLRHAACGTSRRRGAARSDREPRARCAAERDAMNAPTRINSALDVRDQFPAIADWHYLDSAATAQKPQAVIDAITHAYARDYATVHRGVYQRSSDMTGRYEAARAAAAELIGGKADELVFTRGATEAINLVARALPKDGPQPRAAVGARASQQHRAVAARRLRGRRRAADRRRPDRPRRRRSDDQRASIASSPSPMCRTCSARSSTPSAPPRSRIRRARCCCSTAARRCRACRSTSPRSAAISTLSPATSSTARPASARCGAAPSCSTRCRRGRAAAR